MGTYDATHQDVDYTPVGVTSGPQQRLDVWNGRRGQKLPCVLMSQYSGWTTDLPKVPNGYYGVSNTDDRHIEDDDGINTQCRIAHRLIERGDFVVIDVRLSIAWGYETTGLNPGMDNQNQPLAKVASPYIDEYDPNDLDAAGNLHQYGAVQRGIGVTVPPGITYWRSDIVAVDATATPGVTKPWEQPDWHMSPKDLRMAWQHIVANAEVYGIDPDRILCVGTSAGALEMLRLRKNLHKHMTQAEQFVSEIGKPIKPLGIVAIDVPVRLQAQVQANRVGSPDGIVGWMGPARTGNWEGGDDSLLPDGDAATPAAGIRNLDPTALLAMTDWVENPDYSNDDVPCVTSFSVPPVLTLAQALDLANNPGTDTSGLGSFHALEHGIYLKKLGLCDKVYYHNAAPEGDLAADFEQHIDGILVSGPTDGVQLVQRMTAHLVEWAYAGTERKAGTFAQTNAKVTTTSSWQLLYAEDPTGQRVGVNVSILTTGHAEFASTENAFILPVAGTGRILEDAAGAGAGAARSELLLVGSGAQWVRATTGTPDISREAVYAGSPDLAQFAARPAPGEGVIP